MLFRSLQHVEKKTGSAPICFGKLLVYLHRIMGGSTINTFIVLTCREYLCVPVVRHGCHKPSGSLWEIPACDFLTTSSLKFRSTLKHFIFRFHMSV